MTDRLHEISRQGAAFESVFDDLAALRIAVFRDFPYLYEGTAAYEKEYLETYAKSERSLLFAVYDQNKMVGATTCIPLADETPEVRLPFEEAGLDVGAIFILAKVSCSANTGTGSGTSLF